MMRRRGRQCQARSIQGEHERVRIRSKLLVSKEIGRDNVREDFRPAVFHNAHLRPTSNPHEYSNLAGMSNGLLVRRLEVRFDD